MELIGRYRILKRLGGGGFGEVFLGEDPLMDRQVAIKVFRPRDENLIAFATSSNTEGLSILQARFLSEAKILASLESAVHVVNVLDYGELPDGAPYYVMPYLPHSLADELGRDVFDAMALEEVPEAERPRALPLDRCVALLEQLCAGLAAAHAKGLVHRDIKPGNIMLTDEGDVRLVDFGIAKAPDGQHSTVSQLGMGSRNYMAPEQRESAKHVDARADVYAVGRVAYRMLTGRLPVGRFADPEVLVPGLGKTMNALILAALSEDREQRPADAGVLLKQLLVAKATVDTQASTGDGTGTWVASGEAGVRDSLRPLRQRIEALLQAHGTILHRDRQGLLALAAIADLDPADLDKLVEEVLASQPTLRARQRLASTLQAQIRERKRALNPTELAAYHDAAAAVDWSPEALSALADILREEAKAKGAEAPVTPATSAAHGAGAGGKRKITIAAGVALLLSAGGYALLGPGGETPSTEVGSASTVTASNPATGATTLVTIQDHLNRLGYRVPESGVMDTRTEASIRAFEAAQGLLVTGAADTVLEAVLKEAYDAIDSEAWDSATAADTPEAYIAYAAAHPKGAYTNSVADRAAAAEQRMAAEARAAAEAQAAAAAKAQAEAEAAADAAAAQRQRVLAIQTELKRLGRNLTPDGEFGPGTAAAVRAFEKLSKLPERGEPTDTLLSALKAASRWPGPRPGETFKDCANCPEMVVIPSGRFTMGSVASEPQRGSNEGPQRTVTVAGFALGKTEITFAQWDACVSGGGCNHRPDDQGWGRGDRPVINVSWNDAQDYITWINRTTGETYRLPAEAEWEYAARAGTTTRFHTGNCITTGEANFDGRYPAEGCPTGQYREQTVRVGSFGPNAFGLHDMHGNVREWVQDCWNDSYTGAPTDGSAWMRGDCSRAVIRGGSWSVGGRNLRSAYRHGGPRGNRDSNIGFRLARSVSL